MPIVRFIENEKQNPSAMKGSIDYCLQKFKTVDVQTGKRYVSGINCNGLNAYKEFMTTKNVAGASETVMAYINESVERLHSEKIQIQAEIQHLSENRYSANEKIICDFDKFDELPFERKRELANAVIKKIYATSDKIDIMWNI